MKKILKKDIDKEIKDIYDKYENVKEVNFLDCIDWDRTSKDNKFEVMDDGSVKFLYREEERLNKNQFQVKNYILEVSDESHEKEDEKVILETIYNTEEYFEEKVKARYLNFNFDIKEKLKENTSLRIRFFSDEYFKCIKSFDSESIMNKAEYNRLFTKIKYFDLIIESDNLAIIYDNFESKQLWIPPIYFSNQNGEISLKINFIENKLIINNVVINNIRFNELDNNVYFSFLYFATSEEKSNINQINRFVKTISYIKPESEIYFRDNLSNVMILANKNFNTNNNLNNLDFKIDMVMNDKIYKILSSEK